eukprot:g17181.t1
MVVHHRSDAGTTTQAGESCDGWVTEMDVGEGPAADGYKATEDAGAGGGSGGDYGEDLVDAGSENGGDVGGSTAGGEFGDFHHLGAVRCRGGMANSIPSSGGSSGGGIGRSVGAVGGGVADGDGGGGGIGVGSGVGGSGTAANNKEGRGPARLAHVYEAADDGDEEAAGGDAAQPPDGGFISDIDSENRHEDGGVETCGEDTELEAVV